MGSEMGQYLGNQERASTIEKMQQLVDQYPEDFLGTEEQPEKNSFFDNAGMFWNSLWDVVTSPMKRLEMQQRSLGRQGGKYINTMRELSGQKPYSETQK